MRVWENKKQCLFARKGKGVREKIFIYPAFSPFPLPLAVLGALLKVSQTTKKLVLFALPPSVADSWINA